MYTCIIIMVWGLYESMHAHKPVAFCSTFPQKVYIRFLYVVIPRPFIRTRIPGPIGEGWPTFDVSY